LPAQPTILGRTTASADREEADIFRFFLISVVGLAFATVTSGATVTYIRKETTDNFLGWGQTGFYFPQFDAPEIIGPKRTDDNMQFFMPRWLQFNFDPFSLTTTFSADKPDCFDDCRGRGVYTRGGYSNWDSFVLPNGFSGRSGSIVDEQAAANTNNTVNRIDMKTGVPASFCMHVVTDNTDNVHDSAQSIIVRVGRTGDDRFDPNVAIPDLAFDGRTDVHTFRFDGFQPDDFIKIRLNSGSSSMAPGFGGLMFDRSCDAVPNAQCGNNVCNLELGESCETCPGDCGQCLTGETPSGTWYQHGPDPRSHYVAGSDRLLLFAAHGVDALNHRVEGVTYGGQRMHMLKARSQQRNQYATVSVWYLKEGEIQSAVGSDFVVDWDNKPGDRSFESVFFTDVSQTASFGSVEETGCNDCYSLSCPGELIEAGHVSVYAGTHERAGDSFSPLNNYTQDADLWMGGDGRATLGHKNGVGSTESAGAAYGREGAFSLVCFEIQDLPRTAASDDDGDGLTNAEEQALGTLPGNPDTDADGLTDEEEVNTYGTDPKKTDSDNDGLSDGYEVAEGLDPNDASDCPESICGGGLRGWRLELMRQTP
jgi:hypothetical protein